jgi:hypothetical protein
MPSTARLAPSPLLISHPRPRCGGRASTFKEPCSNATQHTTSYKAVVLHPAQGRREATEVAARRHHLTSPSIALRRESRVAKRGKVAPSRNHDHDHDNNGVVGGSDVRRVFSTISIFK